MKKCGIIFYDNDDKKYLLVFGRKSGKWGFPKGHQENGETDEQTAIREFFEETGISIQYSQLKNKIRFKNNIYFNVSCEKKPVLNIQDTKEILKISWFSINELLNLSKDCLNFGLKSWLNSLIGENNPLDFRCPKFINNSFRSSSYNDSLMMIL